MKQLLAILVFVFATVQAQVPGPLDTSFWAEAAGAQTIPPPTSYIVQQTFESTTSDGWIISGNNINTDYAVNPLEGTESCLGNNPSVFSYIYTNFAGFDAKITEGYFKFEFEAVSFDSVASFTISTVNTNDACAATITTGGKLQGDQGDRKSVV